jgi:hypothetical protein
MDHTRAMEGRAAERYALGEMDERERGRYEAHFFGCSECAEEVKAATDFLDGARAVVIDPGKAAENGGHQRGHLLRAPWWDGRKTLFWPVPAGAAAAVLLVLGGPAVYLGLIKVPRLERDLYQAESLQPASWHFLTVSRSEPQAVRIPKGARMVGLTLSRSFSDEHPYYRCELRRPDASAQKPLFMDVPAPPGGDELQMVVPVRALRPGPYLLVLDGLENAGGKVVAADIARYAFTIENQEER